MCSEGNTTVQRNELHRDAFSTKVCCEWGDHSELTSFKAEYLDLHALLPPPLPITGQAFDLKGFEQGSCVVCLSVPFPHFIWRNQG